MKDQKGIEAGGGASASLHLFAIFLAFLTVTLLVAGALVTSNEAGDSVPDWPLSFGRWVIKSDHFVANVRYEYSHRFIAGAVGMATAALAAWTWFTERRAWVRKLALIAFAGVVIQAVIGGVRVHFPAYKPSIAVAHALIAQSFFGVVVSLAVFASKSWFEKRDTKRDAGRWGLRTLTALGIGAVLTQLVLGAGFRHGAFGIIPHVAGAIIVTVLTAWTAVAVIRRHAKDAYLTRPAKTLLVLLAAQVGLGVLAYLARMESAGHAITSVGGFFDSMSFAPLAMPNQIQPLEPMISLTAGHLVIGALTLATFVVLTLRCYQTLAPRPGRAVELARDAQLGSSPRKAAI
ncbi:MAG TPA: COX15/CtaA family protein [Blastocatellia bacterium]|nr:COX15/CtaA family protein [Blastocatellia bacterium]